MLEKQKEITRKINDVVTHAAYLREDVFKLVLLSNFEDFDPSALRHEHHEQADQLIKELNGLRRALSNKDFTEIQECELEVRRRIRGLGVQNDNVVPIEQARREKSA
jgi:hypothetical protein